MNYLVATFFSLLFFFAALLAAGNQIWMRRMPGQWYLQEQNKWPDFGPVRTKKVPEIAVRQAWRFSAPGARCRCVALRCDGVGAIGKRNLGRGR